MSRSYGSWILGLGILLALAQVAMIPVPRGDNHLIGSDGGYYYTYMRSLWMDGDLDITNDIALYNSRMPAGHPARLHVSYVHSCGPGLLWSPAFLLARGGVELLAGCGVAVASDGYSYVEEGLTCLASLLYAMVGLWLLYRLLALLFPPAAALVSALSMFCCSSVIYYALFEPSMAHGVEFFAVCLFLWSFLARRDDSLRSFIVAGAAAGLMTIIRWQDVVFLVVPLLVPAALSGHDEEGPWQRRLWMLAGFLPVCALQCLFWKIVSGSFVHVPQGGGFLRFFEPHILEVLFSTRHGFFLWTPVTFLACLGLVFLRNRPVARAVVAATVLDVYVCSVAGDYWCGDAFGLRRLIGLLPLLALGLGALAERALASRRRWRLLVVAVCFLGLWNGAFMVQYRLGLVPPQDFLTFRQLVTDKVRLPLTAWQKVRQRL